MEIYNYLKENYKFELNKQYELTEIIIKFFYNDTIL